MIILTYLSSCKLKEQHRFVDRFLPFSIQRCPEDNISFVVSSPSGFIVSTKLKITFNVLIQEQKALRMHTCILKLRAFCLTSCSLHRPPSLIPFPPWSSGNHPLDGTKGPWKKDSQAHFLLPHMSPQITVETSRKLLINWPWTFPIRSH